MNKYANALALLRSGVRVQQVKQAASKIDMAGDALKAVGHGTVDAVRAGGGAFKKSFEAVGMPRAGKWADRAVRYGAPAYVAKKVYDTDTVQDAKSSIENTLERRRAEKFIRQRRGY